VLETLEERQLLSGSASADYPFLFGAVHLRQNQASTMALRIKGAKRASSLTARSGQSFHPAPRVSAVDGPQSLRIAGQSSRRPDLPLGGHVTKKVVTSQLTPGTRLAGHKGTTHALSTPASLPTTVSRGGNVDLPSVMRHSTVKRVISAAQTSAVTLPRRIKRPDRMPSQRSRRV